MTTVATGRCWSPRSATVARLQAWLDGRNVRLAARLAEVTVRPEQVVAERCPHVDP